MPTNRESRGPTAESPVKPVIFISYAREDKVPAGLLAESLENNGFVVRRDLAFLVGGDDYPLKIAEAIDGCSLFLLLLSEAGLKSRWVLNETGLAFNSGKPILPVDLEAQLQDRDQFRRFQIYLTSTHRINAPTATFREHLPVIITAVNRQIAEAQADAPSRHRGLIQQARPTANRRPWLLPGAGAIAVLAVAAVSVLWSSPSELEGATADAAPAVDMRSDPSPSGGPPADMVEIPAGSFMVGRQDGTPYEQPPHHHEVSRFWLDITEVTNAAYQAVLRKVDARPSADRLSHPVGNVTWGEANAYCEAKGKRLPSEFEWEYAARGGPRNWQFTWEGPWRDNMTVSDLGKNGTSAPVKTFPSNPFGLYDMLGNVLEWTDSVPSRYPGASYRVREPENQRVIRGAHSYCTVWKDERDFHKRSATYRTWLAVGNGDPCIGFRCAWPPAPRGTKDSASGSRP